MDLIYTKYHTIISQQSMDSDFWKNKFFYFIESIAFENVNVLKDFLKEKHGFTDYQLNIDEASFYGGLQYRELPKSTYSQTSIIYFEGLFNRSSPLHKVLFWSNHPYLLWEENGELYMYLHFTKGMGEINGKIKFNSEQADEVLKNGQTYIESLLPKLSIRTDWCISPFGTL